MMTRIASTLALAGFLTVIAPASTFAQSPPPARPDAPATLDDILKELRALRAELNEATGAGLRAQILVARLALQEQRITGVARELTEIQEKLRASEQAKPVANMLKAFGMPEGAPGAAGAPGQPEAANPFFDMIRGQAEQLEKGDAELKARQEELLRLLGDEQSRWTAFNAQLEALERGATPATRR
jgi:hypothetical protein